MKRKRAFKGILFILPSFAGVCLFWLLPYMDVIRRSFFSAVGGTFTGLKNYETVFANQAFLLAGENTIRFFGTCIPLLVLLSLITAVLINGLKEMHRQLLKTAFLLPMAIPVASVVLLWRALFNGQGILNHLLFMLSLKNVDWMNTGASFGVLVISYIWRNLGYDIVLWLAGLSAIPESLYEAAHVDGAGTWKCFTCITMPNLLPSLFTIVVLSLLNGFKVYREAYLAAGDYPQEKMYLLQHLFNNWYRDLAIDKMSAAAVITGLVIMALILLLQRACEGCSEEKIYRIQVTPASVEVEVRPDYDGEDRKISLDMTLELDICIWKETEADVVEDVYSLREEMTPAYEEVTMSRLLAKNYAKCRLTDHMNLKKNQENILQICSCEGMAFIDHVEPQADGLKVEGSLNVEILYVTTDDAMPIGTCRETFPFEQLIEVPEMTDDMNYELEAGIEQLSAILLDNTQIEVKAVLNLNLIAFSQENIQKMDEIRITERDMEELQRQPGITGYIVREGDSLWKIAKANHTTISQLMEINDLKSEEIQKGDKLLIVKMVS